MLLLALAATNGVGSFFRGVMIEFFFELLFSWPFLSLDVEVKGLPCLGGSPGDLRTAGVGIMELDGLPADLVLYLFLILSVHMLSVLSGTWSSSIIGTSMSSRFLPIKLFVVVFIWSGKSILGFFLSLWLSYLTLFGGKSY